MATVAEKVQQLYIGLLGRAAEPEGLNYWVDTITSNKMTLDEVCANFVSSQNEYTDRTQDFSRITTINELYENLFKRAPETEGLVYWSNGEGQNVPVDRLTLALINGAQQTDNIALENKTEVAEYYTNQISQDRHYDVLEAKRKVSNVSSDPQTVIDNKGIIVETLSLIGIQTLGDTDFITQS